MTTAGDLTVGVPPTRRVPVVIALVYLVAYVAADRATFFNALAPYNITPWNPPPALSLVFVYFYGARAWPLVFLAVVAADIVLRAMPSPQSAVLLADVALSLAYTLAGLALRALGVSARLDSQRDVVWLLLCGLVFSALATGGAMAAFVGFGAVPTAKSGTAMFRFWVGDAVGIMVTAPVLMLVVGRKWGVMQLLRLRPNWELVGQAAAILLSAWIVFHFNMADEFRLIYPLFIPLIWISVSHGLEGAAIGALAMQVGLGLATILAARDADRVTELQFALMAMTSTSLLLGAGVSERRRAAQTVRSNESRLRALFAVLPVGIAEIGGDGRIREANEAMRKLADQTSTVDLAGRPALDALPGLVTLTPHQAEQVPDDSDTHRRWLEVSLVPGGGMEGDAIAVIADITERKETERRRRLHQAEVAQVERINAAGQLAATIAHEVNQPLTSIIYYTRAAQRLLETEAGQDEGRAAMDKAVGQAMRAGEVIRNLRYFLSRGDMVAEPVDLREVLEMAADFLAVDLQGGGVECRHDLGRAPLMAVVDRVQLEQVLLNLMRNAIEAMAGRPPPRRLVLWARPSDDCARIEISDTGGGMADNIAEDPFKPFITTKAAGMGLGLSISRSIIEAAGGTIEVKATGEGGTIISLGLPLYQGEVE